MEDGADAQEEASEYGPQLRDQVELHHLTKVGVVAGGVWLELRGENKSEKKGKKGKEVNHQLETSVAAVGTISITASTTASAIVAATATVAAATTVSAGTAIVAALPFPLLLLFLQLLL